MVLHYLFELTNTGSPHLTSCLDSVTLSETMYTKTGKFLQLFEDLLYIANVF